MRLLQFYGRRPIYLASFSLFLIWLVPSAVAQNIQTMIICRFFNGLAGSAFLSVAGGTVGDLFARHELGPPMMLYTASPFVGPEIGPLYVPAIEVRTVLQLTELACRIGGFINQFSKWRWSFYSLLIWAGLLLVMIVLFVPETYHAV